MKNLFLSAIFALLGLNSFGQVTDSQEYIITGKVQNLVPDRKIYLQMINGRGTSINVDSTDAKADKSFSFKGKVVEGGGYYLVNFFNLALSQKVLLILEGGEKIEVLADGMDMPNKRGKLILTGNSKNVEFFNRIIKMNQDLQAKVEGWNKQVAVAQEKKDEATLQKIQNEFQASQDATALKIKSLLPEMGTNLVAIWASGNFFPNDSSVIFSVADRFKKDGKFNQKNIHVKTFLEYAKRLRGIGIGTEAPEIAMKNTKDSVVALSSMKGKYVLVDFWASWCGPCRRENPNVVRLFYKYKDRGFDILGVSLDRDKDPWLKAIEKDGLAWTQISDLQFWNSAAAQAYGVQAIPASFLLDKDGKVIAKFVGDSAEIEKKLGELFPEK
jgi:peroxiredoxin